MLIATSNFAKSVLRSECLSCIHNTLTKQAISLAVVALIVNHLEVELDTYCHVDKGKSNNV